MTIAENLNAAADLIEGKGWLQNHSMTDDGFCAGAALKTLDERGALVPLAWSFFEDYVGGQWITKWNDHPGRTKEEVIATLRSAAVKARLLASA